MLLIDHNTTSEEVKSWIQDRIYNADTFSMQLFLNRNLQVGYNEALWDALMREDFEIYDNINDITDGNTLLHVGVYAQVTTATMSILLNIGMDHYAYLHVNSKGYTPLALVAALGDEYAPLYDYMLDWVRSHAIAPVINERLQAILSNGYNAAGNQLINKSYDRDGNIKYTITLDLLPVLATRGYNLFNDACTVQGEIQAFINNTIQSHNGEVNNDEITFTTRNTRVVFASDNEDKLKILLCGVVHEEEYVER